MTLYKMSAVKDIPMEMYHNIGTKHNQQYIIKLSHKTNRRYYEEALFIMLLIATFSTT